MVENELVERAQLAGGRASDSFVDRKVHLKGAAHRSYDGGADPRRTLAAIKCRV